MLGQFCYWIFNMSIVASFMGLIVLLLRKIRLIPHRVSVFLWLIPFFRMCIPVGLNNPYSLMSLISKFTTRTVTVYEPGHDISFSATNTIMAADTYYPMTYKINVLEKVFAVAGTIWITGALAILIALTVIYITTRHEIRDSSHLRENIYLSGKVTGPAVYGIIRPRIVLPSSYKDKDLEYIVKHEKTHIRRGDNLWRILGFVTAAIHWFNPLSWIFLKVFLTDLELACDEMAMAGYEEEDRKEYARTLLSCSQSRSVMVSAFGGAKVRTRIENILSYKKMTWFSAAVFTVLILIIIYTLITNAG